MVISISFVGGTEFCKEILALDGYLCQNMCLFFSLLYNNHLEIFPQFQYNWLYLIEENVVMVQRVSFMMQVGRINQPLSIR